VFFENNENSFLSFTTPNPGESSSDVEGTVDEDVNKTEDDGSVTIKVNNTLDLSRTSLNFIKPTH
jgi:hypothetical protein